MRESFLAILTFLLVLLPAGAQVRGTVLDAETYEPVFPATVELYESSGKPVATAQTGADGSFSFPRKPAAGLLRLTCVGYASKEVSLADDNGDVDTVFMEADAHQLSEVTVTSDLRRQSATTETYIITDSLRRGTVNALQLFDRLKDIRIDLTTDEVKVGAESNVPVMVDGRDMGAEYVRDMNPRRIKKVEVLHYPKGKYGDAPIVMNIITASDYVGWDAGVSSRVLYSLRKNHRNLEQAGGDFTLSMGKWSTYGSYNFTHAGPREAKAYSYVLDGVGGETTAHEDIGRPNLASSDNNSNMSVGADWRLASSHTLSVQTWLKNSHSNRHENYLMEPAGTNSQSCDHYDAVNSITGLFYKGKPGKTWNVSGQLTYTLYHVDENRSYAVDEAFSLTDTKGIRREWAFNAEMGKAWGRLFGQLGANISYRHYEDKDAHTHALRYVSRENRYEPYVLLAWRASKRFDVAVGGSLLSVASRDDTQHKSETSFQPSARLHWEIAPWLQLQGYYYCDIQYPNLDQLSPVGYAVNRILTHQGNPELDAWVMHYTEFHLDIRHVGRLTYMLKRTSNEITPWYSLGNGSAMQTLTNGNYHHQYFGFNGDYRLPSDFRFVVVGNYQWYKRYGNDAGAHHGRTWYLDTELRWSGLKNVTFLGEYFLRHDKLPLLQGREYTQEESLRLGVSARLLRDKLQLSAFGLLPVQALAKRVYSTVTIPGYSQTTWSDDRVYNGAVVVSLRWNLGNNRSSKQKNQVRETQEK